MTVKLSAGITIVATSLGVLIASSAGAEITLADYLKQRDNPSLKPYLYGVGKGLFWGNVAVQASSGKPYRFFCLPDNFTMNGNNYIDLLNTAVNNPKSQYEMDTPVELILANELQRTFPCK